MTNSSVPRFQGLLTPVAFRDGGMDLLDQTELPQEIRILRLTTVDEVADAIRRMNVRGAPAIGIAAAYGMVLASASSSSIEEIRLAGDRLGKARPTAINLRWAIDRMLRTVEGVPDATHEARTASMLAEAQRIHAEDIEANRAIGQYGANLLPEGASVLTICNTGALATGGYGTAYGVVRRAHELGRLERVYACETRPRLQGARLTAWELLQDGIPFRLLSDGAAPYLMSQKSVDAVLVGADRIAANGDVANKIGTYALAVAATHHGIPVYSVAPTSTIDPETTSGNAIPIEERPEEEVLCPRGMRFAPRGASAWNPAFDVTPAHLLAGIITESGVFHPPFDFRSIEGA